MRRAPSRSSSAERAVKRIRDRRPPRSPSSQSSRALRTTACRAALGVNPSSRSEPISASCHAPSGRGSRNSPSTVSSVERAARAPTERRRRTSSTSGTLACAAMTDLALVGGTVADVYTGTWIKANVEIEGGVITYVGPREPAAASVHDVSGKVLAPGYIEPHTHPWCLYSPSSLLEVAVPDGTTTLVYDSLFFFLAHGVDGLRRIVDKMGSAPAHVYWTARISPQSPYPDEAPRFATDVIAPLLSWPEMVGSGEITRWSAVAQGDP